MATDYLGSILALVNETGDVAEEMYYDPWGVRRNVANWNEAPSSLPSLLTRGYTGHEHLDDFGLINMNGRLFDPYIARFLSPDNHIQDPLNSQNYNRYSYALNNPLKYNDPDGQWIHIAIGAVVGAVINVAVNFKNIKAYYKKEGLFSAVGHGILYAAVGAGVGALSAATGGAVLGAVGGFGGAILAGAASGAVSSGLLYVGNSVLNVSKMTWKGFGKSVLLGAATGAVMGAAFYGLGVGLSKVFANRALSAYKNGNYKAAVRYSKWSKNLTPKPSNRSINSNNKQTVKTKTPASSQSKEPTQPKSVPAEEPTPQTTQVSQKVNESEWTINGPDGKLKITNGPKLIGKPEQYLKFTADEAVEHFDKHASQIMKLRNLKTYDLGKYVDDANWIINNGSYSAELNGYYSLIGNGGKSGTTMYGFVGLKNNGANISTFHLKPWYDIFK